MQLAKPLPEIGITTRLATMDDLPFIDGLQKMHSKQLGFFPRAQLEGYVRNGWVRIAEGQGSGVRGLGSGDDDAVPSSLNPEPRPLNPVPLGYVASRDRYLKRDELGAIFQLCVVPGRQRGLIGATLLKSVFEASSYGCRLYCCWCAQDLAANHFWEAMGFTAIAFRTGSPVKGSRTRGKKGTARTHIFWQKRVRAGDVSTPWWFPSKTGGGALREDRIVLPIPPGVKWSDEMPVMLPTGEGETPAIVDRREPTPRRKNPPRAKETIGTPTITGGGLRFVAPVPVTGEKVGEVVKKLPRKKAKNDPRLEAAARELRDRWLDELNARPVLPVETKYDVTRRIGVETASGPRLVTPIVRRIGEAA